MGRYEASSGELDLVRRSRPFRAAPFVPSRANLGGQPEFAASAGEVNRRVAHARITRSLIDEYRAMVYPVLVGGGIPFFPQRERRVDLELVETRTFSSRVVYRRYRVAR